MAIKDEEISGAEIRELKALIADQQQRLEILESRQEAPTGEDTKERRSTRRQLLKLAGASLVGAAGAAALKAVPASAANGDALVVGTIRDQNLSNVTGINLLSTAAPFRAFFVNAGNSSTAGQTAIWGGNFNSGRGVMGYGGGTFGTGVYGYTYSNSPSSIGVVGTTLSYFGFVTYIGAGTGVVAASQAGDGLHATTNAQNRRAIYAYTSQTNATGVAAYSQFGTAVNASAGSGGTGIFAKSGGYQAIVGFSFSKTNAAAGFLALNGLPDVKLNGSGRLVQIGNVSGGIGAPNFTPATGASLFGHHLTETVRADDGALWISRGFGAGAVGKAAWKRVNAVRVDSADGAGTSYKPFRAIDTRSGAINVKGTYRVVPIAGTGAGKSAIPTDAVAIIGNLTAVNYTGSGYLAIMPADATYTPGSDPSSVNFIVGQKAIANSFVVGLATSGPNVGKVKVYTAGHNSHFIIDVTGFLQ